MTDARRLLPSEWPECPECEDDYVFPRGPFSEYYTCCDCGLIYKYEDGDYEEIRYDLVYDTEKYQEVIKEHIRKQEEEMESE